MMKFFAEEFNKDDRDYRRFFQSRNVSLPTFGSISKCHDSRKASGKKLKLNEGGFFPIIARKMVQKA